MNLLLISIIVTSILGFMVTSTYAESPVTTISGNYVVMTKYMKYNIPYEITNGTIREIVMHCNGKSLDVEILPNGRGELTIEILKEMMEPITVLTSKYDTLNIGVNENKFTIQFPSDTTKLEFLGNDGLFTPGSEACKNIHNPLHSYLLPPLKQIQNGIESKDVVCKQELELVIKLSGGSPTCVKPETIPKLIERNWIAIENMTSESSRLCYSVPDVGLCKAAIEKYYFDWETNSCKSFTWGGCGGTVPFDTMELCQKLCN